MRDDIQSMASLANKLLKGEEIMWADADGYFGHGIRKEVFTNKTASERAIEMLLAKIAGKSYSTEYKIEIHAVMPAHAVRDIHKSKIALITSGGLVPTGNLTICRQAQHLFGKLNTPRMNLMRYCLESFTVYTVQVVSAQTL